MAVLDRPAPSQKHLQLEMTGDGVWDVDETNIFVLRLGAFETAAFASAILERDDIPQAPTSVLMTDLNRASMFTNRCEILDFWHAIEKAWSFARIHFGQGSVRADRFMERLSADLKAGKVMAVMARLRQIKTSTGDAQDALKALVKYYTDNRQRMRYDEYKWGTDGSRRRAIHRMIGRMTLVSNSSSNRIQRWVCAYVKSWRRLAPVYPR